MRCKVLQRVAANGAPRFGRERLPVPVFLGAVHEVGLFADRTRVRTLHLMQPHR